MHGSLDTIVDTIPLSATERARLAELESVVQNHLPTFLAVGRALIQIRSERLFREQYPTWEIYCQKRWGVSYSHANELARCAQVADNLLASCAGPQGDSPLPPDLSPDALRPLGPLEPELASACWRVASKMGKPTASSVAKVTRTITTAIGAGNGTKPKAKVPQSERKRFVLSLYRLFDNPWFNAHLAVAGLDKPKAQKLHLACQTMITRMHEVLEEIRQQFPSL
jgi:hypothetical protein